MVTVRSAKSKGSQFEYDCQASLTPYYEDVYRTSERGFQLQYDLISDKFRAVFECKRLKGISWNQCKKYFDKLENVKPDGYEAYLLFKSNHQPCLVMSKYNGLLMVITFEDSFGVQFIKHPSTRTKIKESGQE
jgi:hypothetical protein